MITAVVDYGVGNLFSLVCSLKKVGADAVVTADAERILAADCVILPGVGAFGDAADRLRDKKLDGALRDFAAGGKPLMGVCLGMQLLFDESLEYGRHKGLSLLPGVVAPLERDLPRGAKTPHMGWNSLEFERPDDPLLRFVRPGAHVYYVHSYYATACEGVVSAFSDYLGARVPGVVRRGNVCGAQFHPEKSGAVGLAMLRAFVYPI